MNLTIIPTLAHQIRGGGERLAHTPTVFGAVITLALFLSMPGSSLAQSAPSPLAAGTTTTVGAQTDLVITTGTLMQQNVGRRIALYREAGLTTAKLTKLEQLHGDLFLARLNGETSRGLEIRRRIGEALSSEEQAAVDGLLRRETTALRRRLVSADGTTETRSR